MAVSGIQEVDNLLDAAGGPITSTSSKPAIGAVQDLLRGHGFGKMPSVGASTYGMFGKATKAALLVFCKLHCPGSVIKDQVDQVNKSTLEALLAVEPTNAIASQVYVSRRLDLPFTRYNRLSCLVAIGEGQGAFGALCLNTDKAGLSVGLIQWAQYPGRLNELLKAIPKDRITAAFGTEALANKVLAHTALAGASPQVNGGVKKADGKPVDPAMDLTKNDWLGGFRRLCLDPEVQKRQVTHAAAGFESRKGKFDNAVAGAKSERLVAYLLDLVNQFESPAPGFLKKAVDQGGLPATLKERDAILIDRVTGFANAKLRAIGETIKDGHQKWSEAFILKVQKSRSDRGKFFKEWEGLADTAF